MVPACQRKSFRRHKSTVLQTLILSIISHQPTIPAQDTSCKLYHANSLLLSADHGFIHQLPSSLPSFEVILDSSVVLFLGARRHVTLHRFPRRCKTRSRRDECRETRLAIDVSSKASMASPFPQRWSMVIVGDLQSWR